MLLIKASCILKKRVWNNNCLVSNTLFLYSEVLSTLLSPSDTQGPTSVILNKSEHIWACLTTYLLHAKNENNPPVPPGGNTAN